MADKKRFKTLATMWVPERGPHRERITTAGGRP